MKFGALEGDDLVLVVTEFDGQSQVVQLVHVDVGAVSSEAAKAVTLTGKATIDEIRVAMAARNAYDQLVGMHNAGVDLPDRLEIETDKLTSTPTMFFHGADRGLGHLG